jgi:hypothetical protein
MRDWMRAEPVRIQPKAFMDKIEVTKLAFD